MNKIELLEIQKYFKSADILLTSKSKQMGRSDTSKDISRAWKKQAMIRTFNFDSLHFCSLEGSAMFDLL